MKPLHYETQGSNTYVVYEIDSNDVIDSMSLGMLTNNKIHGLAQTLFTQMDDKKYVKYNVSSKVSVSQLFEGAVNKKRLIGVFMGIVEAMLSAEEYMLDPNSILLDLDYIFADVSTYETAMICLPITDIATEKNTDLGLFFKNVIFNTQFDQTENCDHVAQILNYLNSTTVLALEEFKELLEGFVKVPQPQKNSQPKIQPEAPKNVAPVVNPVQTKPISSNAVPVSGSAASPSASPKHQNLQFGAGYSPLGQAAIPPKQDKVAPQPAPQEEEKPISLFYLLQHYNKDNAAAYKAQKAAKKAQKSGSGSKGGSSAPTKVPNTGYAVPGQQPGTPSVNYAVPGQPPMQIPKPVQEVPAAAVNTQPVARPAAPINFGETTVLSGGQVGETTVLGATADPTRIDPHLIRIKNNERIPLNKPVFRIGKERSYVDYFIGDNTAISRSHANIVNHNGEFYVVDTNSTNHTYVNGGMIQSNVETKLSHGTKIRLANEDFEFRLY